MTLQITKRKSTYTQLATCLVREQNSDTHSLDIQDVASRFAVYAHALHREASGRRRARRAARP